MNPLLLLVIAAATLQGVMGHGYMIHPPQRSSMWRANFDTPENYDDNALFCGGYSVSTIVIIINSSSMNKLWINFFFNQVQYDKVNQGRCGECGDEWSLPRPRLHDEGGKYGQGIIGATFKQGEMTNLTIVVTAAHKGYFEFKLCPKSSAEEFTTQDCLDRNLLKLADGTTKFTGIEDTGIYHVPVQLPADIACDHCVIQWHYKAGNSWGSCSDGTQGIGCGAQETFINCADVAITKV